jgi:hypothetical protein
LFSGPIVVRDELFVHALVDQDPLGRGAALPRAQVGADDRPRHRPVQVGVVHHHQRAVVAHLKQLDLARGPSRDRQPGRGRPDERDRGDARMAGDLVADDRAGPGQERDRPRRQVRIGDGVDQDRAAD